MRGIATVKGADLPEIEHALDCAAGVLPLRCADCGTDAEDEDRIRRWQYAVGRNYQAVQRTRETLSKRLQKMIRDNPDYDQACDEERIIRARAAEKDGKVPVRRLDDGTEEIIVPADKQEAVTAEVRSLWSMPQFAQARRMREADQVRIENEIEKPVTVGMHVLPWAAVPLGMKAQYLAFLAPLMLSGVPADLLTESDTLGEIEAAECERLILEEPAPPAKRGLWGWLRRRRGRPVARNRLRILLPEGGCCAYESRH